MALTARQQEYRQKYIGGSDVAAVLGLDPNRTPFDVWYNKTGQKEEVMGDDDPVKNLPGWLGTRFEPIVAEIYGLIHPGFFLVETDLTIHPDYPMLGATPDRLVYEREGQTIDAPDRLLEIKTKNWRTARGFGVPGTDQLPDRILCQVQLQLLVTGVKRCDVAVLVDRDKYWEYPVEADPQVHDFLIEKIVPWFNRHVVQGIQPALQGSKASEWLREKFKAKEGGVMKPATPAIEAHLEQLGLARENLKVFETRKRDLENEIKAFIAEDEGVHGQNGRVTWRQTKDSETIDWEAALKEVMTGQGFLAALPTALETEAVPYVQAMRTAFADAIAHNTKKTPGSRRFLYTPPRED